jgi:sugar/nucleoside kinase (ribokinase family)
MSINNKNQILKVPKLNNKAVDTMGAGDIFHAMVSLLSVHSKNDFFNLFVSQIAGAHAVSYFGNSKFPLLSEITSTYNFYLNAIKK